MSELLDTSYHDRRLARKLEDPFYRAGFESERLRVALGIALDAMRRSAKEHNCDFCRADIAAVERALGVDDASI